MNAPRDIDLGGVLVDPFVRYLFLALVILIAVRVVVGRLGLRSMFANPPLAEAALYVCILVSLVAFWRTASLKAFRTALQPVSDYCRRAARVALSCLHPIENK